MILVAFACALAAVSGASSSHTCHYDSESLKGAHSGVLYCDLMAHECFTIARAAECSLCIGFDTWEMGNWYTSCHVHRMRDAGTLQVERGESAIQAHREWYWEIVAGVPESAFPTQCPDPESEDDHQPVAQTRTRTSLVPQRTRARPSLAGVATAVTAAQTMGARMRTRARVAEEQIPELDAVENALNELEY